MKWTGRKCCCLSHSATSIVRNESNINKLDRVISPVVNIKNIKQSCIYLDKREKQNASLKAEREACKTFGLVSETKKGNKKMRCELKLSGKEAISRNRKRTRIMS